MIKNKITYSNKLKKAEKNGRSGSYMTKIINKSESEAREKGMIVIDEFHFPHAVYQITPKELTLEGLKYAYSRIYDFLKLKNKPDEGITICMSP